MLNDPFFRRFRRPFTWVLDDVTRQDLKHHGAFRACCISQWCSSTQGSHILNRASNRLWLDYGTMDAPSETKVHGRRTDGGRTTKLEFHRGHDTTHGTTRSSRGLDTSQASSLITEQAEVPYQSCLVDTGRTKTTYRIVEW